MPRPHASSTVDALIWHKAQILTHGVALTKAFVAAYGPPYLIKRRAYGNSDDLRVLALDLPQEIVLDPGRVVAAASVRLGSPLQLDTAGDADGFVLRDQRDGDAYAVDFPRTPWFYAQKTAGGKPVNSIITLYGGGSLGIFAYGHCALVDMGAACGYCSIAPNRSRQREFEFAISARDVQEALEVALADPDCPILQVMLNGGNLPDVDKSFSYYAGLVGAARRAILATGRHDVELHLIVYPPYDLDRMRALEGMDVSVAMNTEVYDPVLFRRYCPGKERLGGQAHMFRGLERAVEVLGPGKVFSIFVGGLEPLDSLVAGMEHAVGMGVVPIINVFHADPETPLADHREPTPDEIVAMGRELQRIYAANPFCRPFYAGVGRNSIDNEAYLGMF